eukprot:3378116-Heterocapsa_arctica.AAC.1
MGHAKRNFFINGLSFRLGSVHNHSPTTLSCEVRCGTCSAGRQLVQLTDLGMDVRSVFRSSVRKQRSRPW